MIIEISYDSKFNDIKELIGENEYNQLYKEFNNVRLYNYVNKDHKDFYTMLIGLKEKYKTCKKFHMLIEELYNNFTINKYTRIITRIR